MLPVFLMITEEWCLAVTVLITITAIAPLCCHPFLGEGVFSKALITKARVLQLRVQPLLVVYSLWCASQRCG